MRKEKKTRMKEWGEKKRYERMRREKTRIRGLEKKPR